MTLPTPTAQPTGIDPYTRKPRRSREYHYELGPADDGNGRRVLSVTFGHSSSSRVFTTYVITKTVQPDGAETYWPMEGKHFFGQSVARYSAKALDGYATSRLAAFPALLDFYPKFRDAFTPLLGEPSPAVPGHKVGVTIEADGNPYLSQYGCECGGIDRVGYTPHDQGQRAFAEHLAAVAPQAEVDVAALTPDFLATV